jgi:hypothetical protein
MGFLQTSSPPAAPGEDLINVKDTAQGKSSDGEFPST